MVKKLKIIPKIDSSTIEKTIDNILKNLKQPETININNYEIASSEQDIMKQIIQDNPEYAALLPKWAQQFDEFQIHLEDDDFEIVIVEED